MKKKNFWNQLETTIGHFQTDIPNCCGLPKSYSTTSCDSLISKEFTNETIQGIIHLNKQSMETVIATKEITTDMKKKLRDIQMAISWRDFANTYFQRSSSWFYHKMDGIDGNGGVGGFTEEEAEQLRGALFDL